MTSGGEHSVTASPASNRVGRAVPGVLRTLLEATGWERAFLVTIPEAGDRQPARVEASASVRPDGLRTPSRTVLRRALEGAGIFVCPDVRDDPTLADGASVRSLDIRAVVSVPVAAAGHAAALVVDRSIAAGRIPDDALRLLDAFASVLAALAICHGRAHRPPPLSSGTLVGRSASFLATLECARRVARSRFPVLLVGETGTGKEEIARAIHRDGPRADAPFLALNCAALPETLLESEMFGAVRGAYTGAERDRPGLFRLAHGGTLLLDEVGDMPPPMQAKLLRVLQDGRIRPVGGSSEIAVDVRIVAATHRDLPSLVALGSFRQDLYWRLAMAEVRVPPLRERRDDIPLLAEHLLSRLRADAGALPETSLDPSALDALKRCDWPGNVRQLQAVLARALLRCDGGMLSAAHLDLPTSSRPAGSGPEQPAPLERRWIEDALREARGNVTGAAARIGWSRQKLYRRMKTLGVAKAPER
jgi:two-component system response regulator PilR (NtrC family)